MQAEARRLARGARLVLAHEGFIHQGTAQDKTGLSKPENCAIVPPSFYPGRVPTGAKLAGLAGWQRLRLPRNS